MVWQLDRAETSLAGAKNRVCVYISTPLFLCPALFGPCFLIQPCFHQAFSMLSGLTIAGRASGLSRKRPVFMSHDACFVSVVLEQQLFWELMTETIDLPSAIR